MNREVLKFAQYSPMDFGIAKFHWISYRISIGNLETHQANFYKEIEAQSQTVHFGICAQCIVCDLSILSKYIEKCLFAD